MATLRGLVGIHLSRLWLFVRGGLLGVGPAEYYARRGHIDQSLARAGAGMSGAMRPVWTCTGGADSIGFSGVESRGALVARRRRFSMFKALHCAKLRSRTQDAR